MTQTKPAIPTQAQARQAANVLKNFSHPARLRILCLLHQNPLAVGDLAAALKLTQPLTSQYLATLRKHGLVEPERRQNQIIYHLSSPLAAPLIRLLHVHFCAPKNAR